ncbi:ferritin-like domain-containing protein [Clostridium sp. AL.422]|uniref:ferritin-like domain-containing protein n=1 Tax=Clostridium TaxID=1485 RepID=UPI00293DCF1C|nr:MULTISPECIES: ferritin-like domain-containing protein [unclassified Clostridium]MDV4149672.1 ferritin-like domain-containing protein [Clostridium sp. AL.422]
MLKGDYLDIHGSYSIMLPYPEIDIKEKNLEYAKLIKKCYCGLCSELTLVNQYTYQQLLMNSYLKEIFKKIAMVEEEHLNILGNLIIALGGDPSFSITKRNKIFNWSTKYIHNDTSLKNILINNINNEMAIIKEYRNITSIIDNENIITILNRIILDEELHIKTFNIIYKNEI